MEAVEEHDINVLAVALPPGQGTALPPRLLHLLRSSQAAVLVHKDVAGGGAQGAVGGGGGGLGSARSSVGRLQHHHQRQHQL